MRKLLLFLPAVLCFLLLPLLVLAQSKTLTGKATDAQGNPLPGVSITIKQTASGTVSDADGKFKLSVFRATEMFGCTLQAQRRFQL
jgi:TonB-dependent starch-binding outer membrane protein SusC